MKDISTLIGRILIGFIFLFEAYDSIAFFHPTKKLMTLNGLTWQQDILLITSIVVLIIGGVLVLLGYFANVGAFLLLLYWFPLTFIVYSWWNDPEDIRRLNSILFMRNLAICGGLFLLMAHGAGKYSVRRMIHVLRLPK
jgi:putative oxidoreductase